jgi:hypothetical protein
VNHIRLLFIIFFITTLYSCEKYSQSSIENGDSDLIYKVIIDGEIYKVYSYNKSNLLTEEKTKFHYTRHTFNRSNQIIKSDFYMDNAMFSSNSTVFQGAMNRKEWVDPGNTDKSLTQIFEYDDETHLTKKIFIRPVLTNTEYSVFTYENDRISKQTMYWNNVISGYINFLYDENGNLSRQEKYLIPPDGSTELSTTTEYEYDNMKNPFQVFKQLLTPGIYTNQNNILKEIYTINFEVDSFVEKVQITENTYEYNNKGYPVRVNGITEYIYK